MEEVIKSISTCFSKFATFKGRASRKEFWWFFLFTTVFTVMIDIWAGVGGINHSEDKETYEIISNFIVLILSIPSIAVGARRLHDIGKSGWWQLLMFTIIGFIPLVIWWARISEENSNKYDEHIDEELTGI